MLNRVLGEAACELGAENQKHWGEDTCGRGTSLYKGCHSVERRGERCEI